MSVNSSAASLVDIVTREPWHGDAESIRRIFEALQLPVPQEGEFLVGSDHAMKFFLSRYGIAVGVERIQTDPAEPSLTYVRNDDNPLVSQPLAEIVSGDVRIVLLQGARAAATRDQSNAVTRELERHRLVNRDCSVGNTGLVPPATAEYPEGVPMIIDRGAVKTQEQMDAPDAPGFSPPVKIDRARVPAAWREAEAQTEILSRRFREAWPDVSDPSTVKPVLMEQFWALCRSMTKGKAGEMPVLAAGWNEKGRRQDADFCIKSEIVPDVASAYEDHLAHYLSKARPGRNL